MPLGVLVLYGLLALLVVITGLGMLTAKNAVYAALFLVLNFATVAVLYLILGAPFIALAQVSVYAGAIMVLFLFVIMLLGAESIATPIPRSIHRGLAVITAVVFLAEVALYLFFGEALLAADPLPALPPDFASPAAIGSLLFSQYLLPFEITAIILLSAVIGAIYLTRRERQIKGMTAVQPAEPPIEKEPIY
ncbi:MAG TPA: NADH-quinone oxidoreductase subunit J [Anaerolineaceae bacterium]|nr:NADH-quinone oxidoreductase subunit J [Anaerolineaceae bacterium]